MAQSFAVISAELERLAALVATDIAAWCAKNCDQFDISDAWILPREAIVAFGRSEATPYRIAAFIYCRGHGFESGFQQQINQLSAVLIDSYRSQGVYVHLYGFNRFDETAVIPEELMTNWGPVVLDQRVYVRPGPVAWELTVPPSPALSQAANDSKA